MNQMTENLVDSVYGPDETDPRREITYHQFMATLESTVEDLAKGYIATGARTGIFRLKGWRHRLTRKQNRSRERKDDMAHSLPLRRYPFENIPNFHDLGGYFAGEGGMTRYGVFFRSARLSHATQAELSRLKEMNIRTVVDLRMREEIKERPDVGMDDEAMGWQHISLMGDHPFDSEVIWRNPDQVPPMSTLYQYLIDTCQPSFKRLMETLAAGVEKGAVLFHCTAGKDRTGLTAMMLQALCGVDRLDLIAHYEVSRTYNLDFMPDDSTGSDPVNMITILSHLQERYGGPVGYLEHIGLHPDTLCTLRRALYKAF